MKRNRDIKDDGTFIIGETNKAFTQYFLGQRYLKTFEAEPDLKVILEKVTFEPR